MIAFFVGSAAQLVLQLQSTSVPLASYATHERRITYSRTQYEAACGATVFRMQYGNGERLSAWGSVEQISIDGHPLDGAAEHFTHRVARRAILRVAIVGCGTDPTEPVFRGTMEVFPRAPGVAQAPQQLRFMFRRVEGAWQVGFE